MNNKTIWKSFLLSDIFYVKYGVNLELNSCILSNSPNAINFVSRTEFNNGVSARVERIEGLEPQKSGLITVASGSSSVLSTFLQKEPFYSGRDLYTLETKEEVSDEVKFFLITVIKKNKYKYGYGRQANKTLKQLELSLPIKTNNEGSPIIDKTYKYNAYGYIPNWDFMENYIKSLYYEPITTNNKENQIPDLNISSWGVFKIGDIFKKKKIKHYSAIPEDIGDIPFVSSKSTNNGIHSYVEAIATNGNCITVSTNGDCFDCFYQNSNIAVSSDVEVLYNENLNVYNALFIITILKQEKNKYSYGRKPKNDKVYDTFIKLPINEKKELDWVFMEKYIKSLLYGDKI